MHAVLDSVSDLLGPDSMSLGNQLNVQHYPRIMASQLSIKSDGRESCQHVNMSCQPTKPMRVPLIDNIHAVWVYPKPCDWEAHN